MKLLTETEAALEAVKLSTTTVLCIGCLVGGLAPAEAYQHTARLQFLFIDVRGMSVRLHDAAADQAKAVAAAQAKVRT